jgi:hypothetical protein
MAVQLHHIGTAQFVHCYSVYMTDQKLPKVITQNAQLDGANNEWGWKVSFFPDALGEAKIFGYACIGGQFQFRLDDGICEMYWLNADSESRRLGETWQVYCGRSCSEVLTSFTKLVSETDFRKQALELKPCRDAMERGLEPLDRLVFVAYFVDEPEWVLLQPSRTR